MLTLIFTILIYFKLKEIEIHVRNKSEKEKYLEDKIQDLQQKINKGD